MQTGVRIISPGERSRPVTAAETTIPTLRDAERKRLVLVDGYGLAFRAFHALPVSMTNSDGEITNATFGFTSMLLEVLRAHQPDCVLITFDVGKTFRHDRFEDYKAHRAPMPEEMRGQMTRIR